MKITFFMFLYFKIFCKEKRRGENKLSNKNKRGPGFYFQIYWFVCFMKCVMKKKGRICDTRRSAVSRLQILFKINKYYTRKIYVVSLNEHVCSIKTCFSLKPFQHFKSLATQILLHTYYGWTNKISWIANVF